MGGMVKAIERGYPQKEIAESSYQYQRAVEAKEKIIVGVNDFVVEEDPPSTLYIGENVAQQQTAKLKSLRSRRSNGGSTAPPGSLEEGRRPGTEGRVERQYLIRQHHALHHRRGACLCHGGRNLRGAAHGLWHLYRGQHHLAAAAHSPGNGRVGLARMTEISLCLPSYSAINQIMPRNFNGQIHVRVPSTIHEEVAKEAFEKGTSISGILAQALIVRRALRNIDPWKAIDMVQVANRHAALPEIERAVEEAVKAVRRNRRG